MQTGELSRKTLLCYSTGSLVETSIYGFCGLYLLNFYTDVVHLDPRLIGYALSIRFLVDAFSDPLVGFLSDRTDSQYGRRRPYFLGAIPAAFFFYLLLTPPTESQFAAFIHLTLVSSALITSLTVFGIPYLALSWELTTNYEDRTRISGYRRFMEVVAEVLATLTIPLLLAFAATSATGVAHESSNTEAAFYPTAAAALGCLAVVGALVAFLGTTEVSVNSTRGREGFFVGVRAAYRNRPFVILLVTFTLVAVADRVATAMLFYLLEHLHGVPKQDAVPLFLTFFAGSLCSPVGWIWLSKQYGKRAAYICAMLFWGATFVSFAAYSWPMPALFMVVCLMGSASSGVLILPGAIVPDVIEWEQARTGERREGVYAGVAKFSWKISTGVCFILVGHLLYAVGYDGAVRPTEPVLNGLRIVFATLPCLMLAIAVFVFQSFPITQETHNETLDQIKKIQMPPK